MFFSLDFLLWPIAMAGDGGDASKLPANWWEDPKAYSAKRAFDLALLTGNLNASEEIDLPTQNELLAQMYKSPAAVGSSSGASAEMTPSSKAFVVDTGGDDDSKGIRASDPSGSSAPSTGAASMPDRPLPSNEKAEVAAGNLKEAWEPRPEDLLRGLPKFSSRQRDMIERGYKRPRGGQFAEYHTKMHQLKQEWNDRRKIAPGDVEFKSC